jgi:hypothetical protein
VTDPREMLRQSVEWPGPAASRATPTRPPGSPPEPPTRNRPRPPVAVKGNGKAGSGTAGNDSDDLGNKSKQEPYAMAREPGVPGRSSMTRDQLAEAITGIEQGQAS